MQPRKGQSHIMGSNPITLHNSFTIMNTTSSILITLVWMALWTTTCLTPLMEAFILIPALMLLILLGAVAYNIITNSLS